MEVPDEWQAFPPALLPPQGYAEVFIYSGNDARDALTRLELIVHLDGGSILYKKADSDSVGIRVTWPDEA
ncbi:hypothetical protein NONS58_12990 [Nitrosococcus oceani]|nr:hypothetical protein NONS58_12990 [Nitrosococcus oceani]